MTPTTSVLKPTEDTVKSPGVPYVKTKQEELDFCYTLTDKMFQLSLGRNAHFSNARFMGDFSMTLDEAQFAKCEYIARMCNMHEGSRVLDLGCGWGGMLRHFKTHNRVKETGVVFAEGQYKHCVSTGLNVHYKDMRTVTPEDFGTFDAVTSCRCRRARRCRCTRPGCRPWPG
jgi:cyclopropane-fatty-acyl-phospholipid synthase